MIICRSIYKTDTFLDVILFFLFTTIEEFKCRAAWKVQYRMQPRLCCQLGCGTTCQSRGDKWALFVLRNNYNVKTIITSIFVILPEKTDPDFVSHLPHESDYLPIYNTSCFIVGFPRLVGNTVFSYTTLCNGSCENIVCWKPCKKRKILGNAPIIIIYSKGMQKFSVVPKVVSTKDVQMLSQISVLSKAPTCSKNSGWAEQYVLSSHPRTFFSVVPPMICRNASLRREPSWTSQGEYPSQRFYNGELETSPSVVPTKLGLGMMLFPLHPIMRVCVTMTQTQPQRTNPFCLLKMLHCAGCLETLWNSDFSWLSQRYTANPGWDRWIWMLVAAMNVPCVWSTSLFRSRMQIHCRIFNHQTKTIGLWQ